MLRIGDFSKLSRVSIRMLRHYDEIGLLAPASTDPATGYRYYSESQLPVMNRVTTLRDMGFGLAAIVELLRCGDDKEVLARHLSLKRAELLEQSQETRQRLALLDTALERLRKDGTIMSYTVALKELPQRYVASVRQTIPAYNQEGLLWKILMEETAPLRVQLADPCYSLAVFHDGEYKESDVDVEIQMSVTGSHTNTAHVVFKTEASLQIASVTYQGGYDKINAVNEALANWVEANGYAFNGPSRFIYHVGPADAQDPEQFITEVCYPVKKK